MPCPRTIRTAHLALAGAAALVASALPAQASAQEEPRFRLGLGLGGSYFAVQRGAPPPCCRERERWNTAGAELSVRGTAQLLPWLHAGLDAGVGLWKGGEETSYRDLDVSLKVLRLTPHLGLSLGKDFQVRPRLGVDVLSLDGTYKDTSGGTTWTREDSSRLIAPHIGVAVAAPLTGRLELVGDLGGFWLDAWSATGKVLLQARF